MHGNGDLINGWLKDQQHFKGLVISDYEGIHHIHPETYTYAQQVAAGVNAGIDMFMEPYDFETFESTLTSEVQNGDVPMARIDDAVSRILTKKFQLGLFEHPYTDRTHLSEIGDSAHHAVARRAVAESQVLLKNDGATLPIARVEAGLRRRQQRRQHRQPGGWLDADLAGRLDERDPGADDPRRHRGPARQRHVQPGRVGTRAVEGGRHRRGR